MLHKPGVTAPIFGATKPQHFEDALSALNVKLSQEEITKLEEAYVPHPVLRVPLRKYEYVYSRAFRSCELLTFPSQIV